MAQLLTVLASFPGPWVLFPALRWWLMATCNSSSKDVMPSPGLYRHVHTCGVCLSVCLSVCLCVLKKKKERNILKFVFLIKTTILPSGVHCTSFPTESTPALFSTHTAHRQQRCTLPMPCAGRYLKTKTSCLWWRSRTRTWGRKAASVDEGDRTGWVDCSQDFPSFFPWSGLCCLLWLF